jgi:hypothetical protein
MELMATLMGGCIVVLGGRDRVLYESASALVMLRR